MIFRRPATLVVMTALVLSGCTSYQQAPNLELAHRPAPQGLPKLDTAPKMNTLTVGPKGMEVPIKITWTQVKDNDCSRVGAVKIERTGGPDGVQVETRMVPGGTNGECASLFEGSPDRFDTVLVFVSWKARRGIKTFESIDHPVMLYGDGRADVKSNIKE